MQRIAVELRGRLSREPAVTKKNQDAGDDDERNETNHAIEHHGQKRAGLLFRSLFPEQVGLYDIAAGAAREELVVKHADKKSAPIRPLLKFMP